MSIWPVRLSEWYPFGDERHEICLSIIECTRCLACGDRVRFKKAVGHHSLPFGHGDLWRSLKCLKSGKVVKTNYRLVNRYNRKNKELIAVFKEMAKVKFK